VIFAATDVISRMKLGTPLPDKDAARGDSFTAEAFNAEPFGFRIPSVTGTAACFLVSHCLLLPVSNRNAGNLDLGIILAVPHPFHIMFASPELDDIDFFMPPLRPDLARHQAAVDERLADHDAVIGFDQQDTIELDFSPIVSREFLELQSLTLFDPILFAACLNYRVHLQIP
jgi:hypothetical protein